MNNEHLVHQERIEIVINHYAPSEQNGPIYTGGSTEKKVLYNGKLIHTQREASVVHEEFSPHLMLFHLDRYLKYHRKLNAENQRSTN